MQNNTQNQTISWQGPTMLHHERGAVWYACALVALGLMIAFCIYAQTWSFLSILLLSTVFYGWLLFKPTPIKTITCTQEQIIFGEMQVRHEEVEYFWILDHGHDHELHVRLTARLQDDIRIFLADADVEVVRNYLGKYIKENTEHNEKFIDIITRLLKL